MACSHKHCHRRAWLHQLQQCPLRRGPVTEGMAKPTVAEDKLQEAMDYACGQGGVDCQETAAGGSCFYADNIPSHTSYAFNSYWQKMRRIGGSCDFGSTAVLINSNQLSPVSFHAWLRKRTRVFFPAGGSSRDEVVDFAGARGVMIRLHHFFCPSVSHRWKSNCSRPTISSS